MIEEERDKEKAAAEEKRLAECNKEIYEEHEKKFRN